MNVQLTCFAFAIFEWTLSNQISFSKMHRQVPLTVLFKTVLPTVHFLNRRHEPESVWRLDRQTYSQVALHSRHAFRSYSLSLWKIRQTIIETLSLSADCDIFRIFNRNLIIMKCPASNKLYLNQGMDKIPLFTVQTTNLLHY